MDIRRQLARNLKRLRTEKGWSQEELADQAGLHRTYVSGVERGVRNPTITIVATLAKALGVPAIRAFGGALSIPHSRKRLLLTRPLRGGVLGASSSRGGSRRSC